MNEVRQSVARARGWFGKPLWELKSLRVFPLVFATLFLNGCFNGELEFSLVEAQPGNMRLEMKFPSFGPFLVGQVLSSAIEVRFLDSRSRLQSSRAESVELHVFKDSKCLIRESQSPAMFTSTQNGVAYFSEISSETAGTFYLQAKATVSGAAVYSSCSPGFTFISGSPTQIRVAHESQSAVHSGLSSFILELELADEFGNPTRSSSPVTIQIDDEFSENTRLMYTQTHSVSSEGKVSIPILVSDSLVFGDEYPYFVFRVHSPEMTDSERLIPVEIIPDPSPSAIQYEISEFPNDVFTGALEAMWLRIKSMDFAGVPKPVNESITFGSGGTSQTPVTLQSSSKGVDYYRVPTPDSVSPMSIFKGGFPQSLSASAQVNSISNFTTDCNDQGVGRSLKDGQVPGQAWHLGPSWIDNSTGLVTALAPSFSDQVKVRAGSTMSLAVTEVHVAGCVELDGALVFNANTDLKVTQSRFDIGSTGFISTLGQGGIKFSPLKLTGSSAQRLSFPSNRSVTLNRLLVDNTGLSGGATYAFYLESGGTGELFINGPFSLVGEGMIYVNSRLTLGANFNLPLDWKMVVTPGASVRFLGDAYIAGSLEVLGGGALEMSSGRTLTISSSGHLHFEGSPRRKAYMGPVVGGGQYDVIAGSGSDLEILHTDFNGARLTLEGDIFTFRDVRFSGFDVINPVVRVMPAAGLHAVFQGVVFDDVLGISAPSETLIEFLAPTEAPRFIFSTVNTPSGLRGLKPHISSSGILPLFDRQFQ